MDQDFRWADQSDDEESLIGDNEFDHVYLFPLKYGPDLVVHNYRTFIHVIEDVRNFFYAAHDDDDTEEEWECLHADLTDINDVDEMDAASRDFKIFTSSYVFNEVLDLGLEDVQPAEEVFLEVGKVLESELQEAVEGLNIDDAFGYSTEVGINIPHYDCDPRSKDARSSSNVPPLAPETPDSKVVGLVLKPHKHNQTDNTMNDKVVRRYWSDIIEEVFELELPQVWVDEQSLLTDRSRTRRQGYGRVFIEYENSTLVDVGSHGYQLDSDLRITLDMTPAKIDEAIVELTTAPAGECLTTATPSHLLHQAVAAVIAHSVVGHKVLSEDQNIDVTVHDIKRDDIRDLYIDVTTSIGIFSKKLNNPKSGLEDRFKYQAAVSKYDLASVIMGESSKSTSEYILKMVANCISVEYPGVLITKTEDLPPDLQLQNDIYQKLSTMSQSRIKDIGEMCHDAAVLEGLDDALNYDKQSQGVPYKDKILMLREKISSLEPRNGSRVAFPPIPLSEITKLEGTNRITVVNHDFYPDKHVFGQPGVQSRYDMGSKDECDYFLAQYPVVGLFSHEDAKKSCKMLDKEPLFVGGLVHKGPGHSLKVSHQELLDLSNELYSKLSVCQYAEILSDLARTVFRKPSPPSGKWDCAYLYKGKVCAWYRVRDNMNSAEGFRVDWFAHSSFEVAGGRKIQTSDGKTVYLWPRQRVRSTELEHYHRGPRRLAAVIYSIIEKKKATGASMADIIMAVQRMALVMVTSSWASGENYITARYLSATLGSPSSPFHEMGKKLKAPKTFADVFYLTRLDTVLRDWTVRDQYRNRAALLGLPRHFSQLESYWMMWVPSQFADSNKNMAECAIGLCDEALKLKSTLDIRSQDLEAQAYLLDNDFTISDLRTSLRGSCTLNTDGKFGWSFVGSFASAVALKNLKCPSSFDAAYSKKRKSRTMADHMTVRHSARVKDTGALETGTVAEMMINSGLDPFLSSVGATFRFLFKDRPIFFNHPKKGEHKNREISITDPDSRICLSDSELICGSYGKMTGIDFLKDPKKNKKFYDRGSRSIKSGGVIQSSDASRYGPMMSNMAIAIMCVLLGAYSMHLKWCSVVYARLAFRRMLIPDSIMPELAKKMQYADSRDAASATAKWLEGMDNLCHDTSGRYKSYTTSHHMGQGMSHHSSSLMHAGAIAVTRYCVSLIEIRIGDVPTVVTCDIMVTSDDSTLIVHVESADGYGDIARGRRQTVARVYVGLFNEIRTKMLRMVSVSPNLVKEIVSGVSGEFNSQDTGIGQSCPILGFRELISKIVSPSSSSLTADYINSHAIAREVAMAGQGVSTATVIHGLLIDMIEERWSLMADEKMLLETLDILPRNLVVGCSGPEILSSPESWLNPEVRANLLKLSKVHHSQTDDIDPHTRDTVFGTMMLIKTGMPKQHRSAITKIKTVILEFTTEGKHRQAVVLNQSLVSTAASSKTRNLGRIGHRIRNRPFRSTEILDQKITSGTMLETTLNWLHILNTKCITRTPTPDDIADGNQLAGYIITVSPKYYNFPAPPRHRACERPRAKKPLFIQAPYANTPFGVHAVSRYGGSVVEEWSAEHRERMVKYSILKSYRIFSDHIVYGSGFVTSWHDKICCSILPIDISKELAVQQAELINLGDFSSGSVDKLRKLQSENPSKIVMALHRCNGLEGTWHCVYGGVSMTVSHAMPNEEDEVEYIDYESDGREYILAIQGTVKVRPMEQMSPTEYEIRSYQERDYESPMPKIVRSLEDSNIKDPAMKSSTYGTTVLVKNGDEIEETYVYCAPTVRQTPHHQKNLKHHLGYLRAGVIANAALAGYWYSNIRGVCMRAYLKGHFFDNTVWTSSVLGWRGSISSIPGYYESNTSNTVTRGMVMLDGFTNADSLELSTVDVMGTGYAVVSTTGMRYFSNIVKLDSSYSGVIYDANHGARYDRQGGNGFMTVTHSMNPATRGMTAAGAMEVLKNHLMDTDEQAW